MRVDYLIIGQGLAGTVLALELIRAGKRVLVVDNGHRSAASTAAAGIINPVTGKRLARSWKIDVLLPSAMEYYSQWEREYGATVFHPRTVRRFLNEDQRRRYWPRRRASGELNDFLVQPPARDSGSFPGLCAEGEPVEFGPAGFVDTRVFLEVSRNVLAGQDAVCNEDFHCDALRIGKSGVTWGRVRAGRVIFCEGYRAAGNPFFDWLPFTPAKGEILGLRLPGIPRDRILNNGKWLLPAGGDEVRVGATYEWARLDERPTESGRRKLLEAFRSLVDLPAEVLDHRAGVRSILKDTKPVAGLHPGYDSIGVFNGLGSKGVMIAPYYARQFVTCLEQGRSLDDEVDVRRNF